jgi:DNA-binding transcriptional ArsR family regulator
MNDPAAERLSILGRALGHPLRVQILSSLMAEEELSPVDMSESLGVPLANVAYHVRYLLGLQALELRGTMPRRGAVQHFYALPAPFREALSAAVPLVAPPDGKDGKPATKQSKRRPRRK